MISLIASLALSAVVAILLGDNMALAEEDRILLFVAMFLALYAMFSLLMQLLDLLKSARKQEQEDKWPFVWNRLLGSTRKHATVLVAGGVTVALMTSYLLNTDSAAPANSPKATPMAKALAASAPASTATAPQKLAATEMSTVAPFVRIWAKAWETGQADLYLSMYSPQFTPADGAPRAEWEKLRRKRVGNAKNITIGIVDLSVTPLGQNRAEAVFTQHYTAKGLKDVTRKTLTMEYVNGQWLMMTERAEPLLM